MLWFIMVHHSVNTARTKRNQTTDNFLGTDRQGSLTLA